MSCCPPAPAIKVAGPGPYPNVGAESDMLPGESLECYINRAGNQTGKMDDATALVLNKIENNSIPIKADTVSVDVTFRLTTGSTAIATTWEIEGDPLPTGITFTSNGATAKLSGTFPESSYDKPISITVKASGTGVPDNPQPDPAPETPVTHDGLIDARNYKFSPTKKTASNSIELIMPLPGAIVNSKFGLRKHPISGVSKPHTGIDLKIPDRSTKDVVAAADGKVIFSGVSGTLTSGYGNCVKIEHYNGSGKLLCTTLYGHLRERYVAKGDTVAAGQKIGHEGTTGSSTGNHLHFEVQLPGSGPTDPVPFIRENVTIADTTSPAGEAVTTSTVPDRGAAVSTSDNAAKAQPCPSPAVDPLTGAPAAMPDAAPPDSSDPFEIAWYFTMKHEVGPFWTTDMPNDPEVAAGLHETDAQKKKVGYKDWPKNGGITKFGIAQNPNRPFNVDAATYSQCKAKGRSGYWDVSGATKCEGKAPLLGIMLFDINYLHGVGGARSIWNRCDSSVKQLPASASQDEQLAACEKLNQASIDFINTLDPSLRKGWLNRCALRLAQVKSVKLPLV